jgi:hypothetical protein
MSAGKQESNSNRVTSCFSQKFSNLRRQHVLEGRHTYIHDCFKNAENWGSFNLLVPERTLRPFAAFADKKILHQTALETGIMKSQPFTKNYYCGQCQDLL